MKRYLKNFMSGLLCGSCILMTGCNATVVTTPAKQKDPVLPSHYDMRDEGKVTSVKYQGKPGTCWAYAAISAAESNLIVNGYADSDVDLSENHMVYYSVFYNEDLPLKECPVDGIYVTGKKEDRYLVPYNGGSSGMGICMMSVGMGPVSEELAPIIPNKESENARFMYEAEQSGKVSRYMGDYLVTEWNTFSGEADINDIKSEILEKGAVTCSTAFVFHKTYKAENGDVAIFSAKPSGEKHVVSLIGWDDEYSRDNFVPETPKNNGAWIVKDSTKLSDNGFFYLSYEYPVLSFNSFELSPKSEYGSIITYDTMGPSASMQPDPDSDGNREDYDGCGLISTDSATSVANVFRPNESNKVKAAGLFTIVPNQKVRIRVFINPEENKPDSGEMVDEFETVIKYSGYQVVDLNKEIPVEKGDCFSIVVDYCGDKAAARIAPVEIPADRNDYKTGNGIYLHYGSNPGESFGQKDGEWYDLSKDEAAAAFGKETVVNNAPIRALMEK